MSSSSSSLQQTKKWYSFLGNIANRADGYLRYYFPLAKQHPTELDGYEGRFSHQQDFIKFKSLMKVQKQPNYQKLQKYYGPVNKQNQNQNLNQNN